MEVYDYKYSIGRGYNRTKDFKEGWTEGSVATKHGYVEVYAQGCDKFVPVTRLEIIKNGVVYVRSFKGRRYTRRAIKTKADQFANDIFA